MRLKMQLTRLLMVCGLALMTAGISHAGGGSWGPEGTYHPVPEPDYSLVLYLLPAAMGL